MTLDDLDLFTATTPATNNGGSTRKCPHPRPWRTKEYAEGRLGERVLIGERCRCDHLIPVEKMRRASLAIRAGKDAERKDAAKRPDRRRVGQYNGPEDTIDGLFVTQSKAGASYFSERYWRWLQALPRAGGRIPRLVVSDGRRSVTVYITSDDDDLHGPTEGVTE